MKFSIEVDCSPEEARAFLGWPDFSAGQQELVDRLVKQMQDQMSNMGLEDGMKMMFGGAGAGGWQEAQKAFWSAFSGKAPSGS